MTAPRSGFVSIIGKPNVGKSTLLNRLVGMNLAGVSKRPQTTREVIRGILTEPRGQVVFVDTPGYHHPKDSLGVFMVRETKKTFADADLFYLMVEPALPDELTRELLSSMQKEITSPASSGPGQGSGSRPIFCLVNKTDAVSKPRILPVLDAYQKLYPFSELIPISSLKGDQVNLVLEKTFDYLPEHEPYFPSDIASDQTERFLAAERIREKVFLFTGEEIPYSTAVEIESFEETDQMVRIHAVIFAERDSQKAILIGSGGAKMKELGTAARKDLETFLGKKVFLNLWVKTLKNWKKDERQLKRFGYR